MLWIQAFKPVTIVMLFALIAMFMRHRGLTVKDFFKTPHDWLVLIYCLWMTLTSPDIRGTWGTVYPLYIFYVVTVQALSTIERIRSFLWWWAIMIFLVSLLAVLSLYGYDPTGGYDLTMGPMKGRLCLGTSIFNNPNALGHTVVPVIVMLYYLFIWKRPIFVRIGALVLFAAPLYCIYETQSKGAYLAGFASIFLALCFGRPKIVQALMVAFAFTVGVNALKTLPRMDEMNNARAEGGIVGRLAAFRFGKQMMEQKFTGLGKDRFVDSMWRAHHIWKASHSSFVQIGAELGRIGFFLFLGILYCCLRTLVTSNSRDDEEERVRRILFAMIIGFMVSSWMVDFAYRAALFMMVAAIAGYHRLMLKKKSEVEQEETAQDAIEALQPMPFTFGGLQPAALPTVVNQTISETVITVPPPRRFGDPEPEENPDVAGLTWNRIGIVDLLFMIAFTVAATKFWGYIMFHI